MRAHLLIPMLALFVSLSTGCLPNEPAVPGQEVFDTAQLGRGPCAHVVVAAVIEAVHQQAPGLSSISVLRSDNVEGASGDVVVFARDDGGFDLAFEYRAACDSGRCLAEQYWYFGTDELCLPLQLGTYLRYQARSCWDAAGIPLWGVPARMPQGESCGG